MNDTKWGDPAETANQRGFAVSLKRLAKRLHLLTWNIICHKRSDTRLASLTAIWSSVQRATLTSGTEVVSTYSCCLQIFKLRTIGRRRWSRTFSFWVPPCLLAVWYSKLQRRKRAGRHVEEKLNRGSFDVSGNRRAPSFEGCDNVTHDLGAVIKIGINKTFFLNTFNIICFYIHWK